MKGLIGILFLTTTLFSSACDKLGLGDPPPKSESVLKLEGFADKACACKDGACADAVTQEVNAFAAGITQVAEADRPLMQAAQSKIDVCLSRVKSFIVSYKGIVDEICGCTDVKCAEAASKKFDKWSKDLTKITEEGETRVSQADLREITLSGSRARPCFEKFNLPIPK